jgi:glycerol kinase
VRAGRRSLRHSLAEELRARILSGEWSPASGCRPSPSSPADARSRDRRCARPSPCSRKTASCAAATGLELDATFPATKLRVVLGGADWDDELLELFGVPRSVLPPVVDTDAIEATIEGLPVRAAAGDQQASLFGCAAGRLERPR